MACQTSWLAIKGKSIDESVELLNLRRTGKHWVDSDSSFGGCRLKNGWYVIQADRANHNLVGLEMAERISVAAEIVTCSLHEDGPCSVASAWADGKKLWSVSHDGDEAPDDITVRGELPKHFHKAIEYLKEKHFEEASTDYLFEIPIELARLTVGYRHDNCPTFQEDETKSRWKKRGYDDDAEDDEPRFEALA